MGEEQRAKGGRGKAGEEHVKGEVGGRLNTTEVSERGVALGGTAKEGPNRVSREGSQGREVDGQGCQEVKRWRSQRPGKSGGRRVGGGGRSSEEFQGQVKMGERFNRRTEGKENGAERGEGQGGLGWRAKSRARSRAGEEPGEARCEWEGGQDRRAQGSHGVQDGSRQEEPTGGGGSRDHDGRSGRGGYQVRVTKEVKAKSGGRVKGGGPGGSRQGRDRSRPGGARTAQRRPSQVRVTEAGRRGREEQGRKWGAMGGIKRGEENSFKGGQQKEDSSQAGGKVRTIQGFTGRRWGERGRRGGGQGAGREARRE